MVFSAAPSNGPECSANQACADLGLAGLCCPTPAGDTLDCCAGPPAVGQLCSENTACDALGLSGNCCPTNTGVQLGCCDDPVVVASALVRMVNWGDEPDRLVEEQQAGYEEHSLLREASFAKPQKAITLHFWLGALFVALHVAFV